MKIEDIYKNEFAVALKNFQVQYRASTSGDLQTFMLGIEAGVKILDKLPKKRIELELQEFIDLGGDISKLDGINIRVSFSGLYGQISKIEFSRNSVNGDYYNVIFTDGTLKEMLHVWINIAAEFSLNYDKNKF